MRRCDHYYDLQKGSLDPVLASDQWEEPLYTSLTQNNCLCLHRLLLLVYLYRV